MDADQAAGHDHGSAKPSDDGAPYRYLTLEEARALECNGCGDCCDSRRTDGFWTWGSLPPDRYASTCGGEPLIIPIARVEGDWCDRPYDPEDAHELSATRFRCSAFRPAEDGTGACGRHDRSRPARCGEFPVGGSALESELAEHGSVLLQASAFPRCTWYRVIVALPGHPRLVS